MLKLSVECLLQASQSRNIPRLTRLPPFWLSWPEGSSTADIDRIFKSKEFALRIDELTGVIMTETPTGCRMNSRRESRLMGEKRASPLILLASSANHSRKELAYFTSPRLSAIGLPCNVTFLRIFETKNDRKSQNVPIRTS